MIPLIANIENKELTNTDDVEDDPEEHNNDSEVGVEEERWTNAAEKHNDDLGDDLK